MSKEILQQTINDLSENDMKHVRLILEAWTSIVEAGDRTCDSVWNGTAVESDEKRFRKETIQES